MCGIAALIAPQGLPLARDIRAMSDIVRHRGPDGEGYAFFAGDERWRAHGNDTPQLCRTSDAEDAQRAAQVALGHRRLSIVDVTAAGHQPMASADDRYWIVFNGEIYNYPELREQLQELGYSFVSHSDTEVILAAFDHWGRGCLDCFNGMFAFVLYDRKTRRIFAARDRFGVKPLYWWRGGGRFAFISEIKQLTVLPGWQARLNGQNAYEYLNWGLSDHTDATLFAGVQQVPAGTYIDCGLDEFSADVAPVRWYDIRNSPAVADTNAVDEWRKRFLAAVRVRLRADVPVGTALSGGLEFVVDRLRGQSAAQTARHRRRAEQFFRQVARSDL